MSWLFSQALVAAYSAATCSDGAPYAQLNLMPTQHPFWRNGRTMDACRFSRFGLTCEVLTESHGEDLLTWFREDFLAKTSVQQGKVQASKARDPAFGEKWQESLVRYDLHSCSWRTAPYSDKEVLPWSSVTLPRWGMMLSGFVFQRKISVRPISGIVFGLWPTPTATDANGYYQAGTKETAVPSLLGVAKLLPTPAASDWKGRYTWETVRTRMKMTRGVRLPEELSRRCGQAIIPNPEFWEWMMGWPIGWTGLRPLETAKFREWQRQHGV